MPKSLQDSVSWVPFAFEEKAETAINSAKRKTDHFFLANIASEPYIFHCE